MAHSQITTHQETIEEIRLLQYAKSQLEKATNVNDIIISIPGLDIKHRYHNKLAKNICRSIAHTIERYCLSMNKTSINY